MEQLVVNDTWLGLTSDRQYADLTYTGRMPYGCWSAAWTMEPGDHGLYRGQSVDIYDGTTPIWAGHLAAVDPQTGEYNADGAAREAEKRLALISGAASGFPGATTDDAITRGMNWAGRDITPSFSVPVIATATLDTGPVYLQQLLDAGAEESGTYWWVPGGRILRMDALATDPEWFIAPGYVALGVDDEDYAQYVFGRFFNSGTSAYATATAEDTAAPWGGAEKAVSLVGRGPMTSARANSIIANVLARDGARLAAVGSIEVDASNLTNAGGTPADVMLVTEGQRVRALGVFADGTSITPYLDFNIGEIRHTKGESSITLQPIGRAAANLQALFEKEGK